MSAGQAGLPPTLAYVWHDLWTRRERTTADGLTETVSEVGGAAAGGKAEYAAVNGEGDDRPPSRRSSPSRSESSYGGIDRLSTAD